MVFILGTAVMPHLMVRVGASRTGRTAQLHEYRHDPGRVFALLLIHRLRIGAVAGATDSTAVDTTGRSSSTLPTWDVLGDGSAGPVVLITLLACVVFLSVLINVTSVVRCRRLHHP
ncbi:hypothetical protein [Streptomyces sp. NPDC101234]|uniref:hypothetical protein n=1 Tax=Streptomyces sp. NPDC101234 TaxID=3366138 RepID=UPI00382E8BFE